jgi:hypothetical protein
MIELTPAQAHAVAELADREGRVSLHQLAHTPNAPADDIYATPHGAAEGYRISPDGQLTKIGETLPSPE